MRRSHPSSPSPDDAPRGAESSTHVVPQSGMRARVDALADERAAQAQRVAYGLDDLGDGGEAGGAEAIAVRLDDVCATVLDRFRAAARRKRLRVSLELTDCFSRVICDAARLERALDMLLDDVVQATPDAGRMGLSATVDAALGQARIVVWEGEPDGDASALASRPTTPSPSPAPRPDSIARAARLMEQHGGTLETDGEPGHGRRHRVTLPLRLAPAGA